MKGLAEFRITFGESLSECYTSVGEKNAGNDHAPRDFKVQIPFMSDLTFGQSGFRFAKVELLSENPVSVKNIFAVNTLPVFEKEVEKRASIEAPTEQEMRELLLDELEGIVFVH